MLYYPAGGGGRHAGSPDQGPDEALDLRGPQQLPHLALPHRGQSRAEHVSAARTSPDTDLVQRLRDVSWMTRQTWTCRIRRPCRPMCGCWWQEARIGCTSGMLLCLDREQRLVYILGEILGVPDTRWRRSARDRPRCLPPEARAGPARPAQLHAREVRARQPREPVPLREENQGFIKAGYLDPHRLLFARAHVTRVHEVAPRAIEGLEALDAASRRDSPRASIPRRTRLSGGAAEAVRQPRSAGRCSPDREGEIP